MNVNINLTRIGDNFVQRFEISDCYIFLSTKIGFVLFLARQFDIGPINRLMGKPIHQNQFHLFGITNILNTYKILIIAQYIPEFYSVIDGYQKIPDSLLLSLKYHQV